MQRLFRPLGCAEVMLAMLHSGCDDAFCPYPDSLVTDPAGECDAGRKVIRGGSWYFNAESARSTRRYTHHPEDRGFSLGFRVVREAFPDKPD